MTLDQQIEIKMLEQLQNKDFKTAFATLQRICEEENYTLEILSRYNRQNTFEENLDAINVLCDTKVMNEHA